MIKNNIPRIKNFLLCLLCSGFISSPSSVAHDDVWVGNVETEVILPPSKSILDIRKMLYNELNVIASKRAGAVVLRTETLDNGRYLEVIDLISASHITLSKYSESMSIVNGDIVIYASAIASVDLNVLKDRLAYTVENISLRRSLSELTDSFLTLDRSGDNSHNLPIPNTSLRSASRSFSESTVLLFSNADTMNYSSIVDELKLAAKRFIDNDVEVSARVDSMTKSAKGIKVLISYDVETDLRYMEMILSKYWATKVKKDHLMVFVDKPTNSLKFNVSDNSFVREVLLKNIFVRVNVNDVSTDIPLSFYGDDFLQSCKRLSRQPRRDLYCLTSHSTTETSGVAPNPVSLFIPREMLTDDMDLDVRVEVQTNDEPAPFTRL